MASQAPRLLRSGAPFSTRWPRCARAALACCSSPGSTASPHVARRSHRRQAATWRRIVACDGGGDGGDEPAERLMRDVLFAFAAHERRMVAARTAAALAAKRARGERYCATPRLGERFAGGRLETDQAEARAVALISRLRARGLSVRGIVAELERRPQHRPRGRCWHATTVVRVLRRAEG
jgi:hypothetical protein